MSIHRRIYETLYLPEDEALKIVGGGDIKKRRKRMLDFLSSHEWDENTYKDWIRNGVITEWNVEDRSRGIGDTVAKITHATGINKLVEYVSKKTGKPCGCKKRQKKLNEIIPYGH